MTGETEGTTTEWRFIRFVMTEASFSFREVIETDDVGNVSDRDPVDDLWEGVKGMGRLKFSFPAEIEMSRSEALRRGCQMEDLDGFGGDLSGRGYLNEARDHGGIIVVLLFALPIPSRKALGTNVGDFDLRKSVEIWLSFKSPKGSSSNGILVTEVDVVVRDGRREVGH